MITPKLSSNTKQLLEREIDPAFSRRAEIILENLKLSPGMRVLDIGCGRGFYLGALAQLNLGVEIFGLDHNSQYLKLAAENLKTIKTSSKVSLCLAESQKLPFNENYFDRVICSEVLEHVKDDEEVISEIFRVLKKGGMLLLSVPVKNYPACWDPLNFFLEHTLGKHLPSKIWWLSGIWADHLRLYDQVELLYKLQKRRFKINKVWQATTHCLPFAHFLLYGIGKNLVERKMIGRSFNRFSFQTSPSFLLKLVINLFRVFDRRNDFNLQPKRFLNLVVQAQK